MRKTFRLTLLSIAFLCFLGIQGVFAQLSDTQHSINWSGNLDYSKLIAEKYNNPLFVFFVDVPPSAVSKSVYNGTLSNDIVANKVNSSFVPVLVQGDTVVQDSYNITDFPTLLILDPRNFTEISRLVGIMTSDIVFTLMQNALETIRIGGNVRAERDRIGLLGGNESTTYGNNNLTYSLTSSRQALVYEYKGGAFLFLGEKNWVHSTPFYPRISYSQFHMDENHFFISNRELNIYFALPRERGKSFWVLKKGKKDRTNITEDEWIVAGRIDEIVPGNLEKYIIENTTVGQEN